MTNEQNLADEFGIRTYTRIQNTHISPLEAEFDILVWDGRGVHTARVGIKINTHCPVYLLRAYCTEDSDATADIFPTVTLGFTQVRSSCFNGKHYIQHFSDHVYMIGSL